MKLIFLVFEALLVVSISTSHAQNLTKVEIFYETLNEPVRRLFVEQYRSVFESLNDKIDLRLFPYGRTTKVGDKYTCDSDLQCEANKIHACLIKAEIIAENPTDVDQEINQISASNFVQCFFKNRKSIDDVDELGNQCMPGDASADWTDILVCVRENNTITSQFETVSEPVKNELAKTGLVVRVDNISVDLTTTSFAGAICDKLTDPKPDICTQAGTPATKVKIGVFYEAQSPDANKYLDKQLGNFYHVIEDFVDIDLVPYGNTVKTGDTYNCTLGTSQCISNKFQALVVDKYLTNPKGDLVSGPNRVVNFVRCLAQSNLGSELTKLEVCSRDFLQVDDYRTFIEFIRMNSDEVKKVFENMRTKTASLLGEGNTLPRVPTVTVNGQLDYNALDDLVQEACNQTTWIGPKSSICTKIDVVILYEALNQRSRSFFLEHFNPIFHNMYALLNVQLVPAGRSVMVPGNGLTCYNGYDQCIAMELQACAIDNFWNDGNNYTDPIRQEVFDFIWCTFKNKNMRNVMDAAETCANDHIELDAWVTIHGCFIEGMGQILVADNIETTQSMVHDMEHHDVPAVFVNGTNVTDLASIRAIICGFYDIYHQPDICLNDEPSKVDISVYFESTSELSKHFFTTQYDPWYIYIEEMVNIKLFPAGNVRETLGDNGTCDSYDLDSACMSNKLLSMVIDRYLYHDDGDFIPGSLRVMRYLSCLYSHNEFKSNIYNAHEYCEEESPFDDWFDLLVTAKSEIGAQKYAEVLSATKQLNSDNGQDSLSNIPWVTLNNRNFSRMAQNDLMQTVCEHYGGEKPLECTQVEVTIYYSAIHAQSRRFFIDQVKMVYLHLRERIHLQLVPYGLADASSTIEKECEANQNVCEANKAQACAIKSYFDAGENTVQWDGRNQTITFIICMFKNVKSQQDVHKLIEDCANIDYVLADEVSACVRDTDGQKYLSEMRNRTLEQIESMEHAPWIVINGVRSALAQSDLKTAICDAMVGDKPDYCYEPTPAKVNVVFHYSAQDSKVQDYVLNELYPHYRNLEEIVDLDVVPFGLTEIKTNEDGNYTLICDNGLNECRVNLIHGCLYKEYYHNDDDPVSDNQEEYDGKLQFIEYLYCYFEMSNFPSNIIDAATSCGEKIFGDVFSSALECAKLPLGVQILQEFEEKKVDILLPRLTYIPWMTVDSKHSYTIEHHIQRTICDSYTGKEKPLDCYQIYDTEPKPEVEVHYEPGHADSKYFFTKSLMPDHVFEIGKIKLIPFGRSTYTADTKKCIGDETCGQYKEHACLLDVYFNNYTVLTLESIACTFEDDVIGDADSLNECVNKFFGETVVDPYWQIEACVKSDRANELMTENANLVSGMTPRISHVPWVLINEEHNIEAEVSLCNELCSTYYPADKPPLCKPTLLPVNIYYETKNSDVGGMMLGIGQYREYLDEMGDFSFIPYGKTTNNNGELNCPVDANQCQANKVHACVLKRFYNHSSVNLDYEKNRIRTVGFIICTFFQDMGSPDAVANAEICLHQNFDSLDLWPDINGNCVPSLEGKELMEEMGRQTDALDPKLETAPYVTIGSKYNKNAKVNLIQALCDAYPMVKAPLCATLPNYAVKVGVYFSGNAAAQKLFIEQVLPFYKEIIPVLRDGTSESKLHALINPEIVAWGATKYDKDNAENPFTCDTSNECYINRFFACATHYHGSEPRATLHLMELTLCFFANADALNSSSSVFNSCANRIWLVDPFPEMEVCATQNTPEMIAIFLKAMEKTKNNSPELTTFPAITLDNIYNNDASSNLLGAVCALYQGNNRPTECDNALPTFTPTPTSTPTPTPSPGSGTMPVISAFVFLVSFILSFILL